MGLAKQLRDIETSLAIINEFPTLTHLPVIIGESDPEGCAACSARVHPQNGYRNGPLYGVYVVESMLRTYELSGRAGIAIEGAVTWAFMFDQQPYFDGFRDLATNGIDKAVLNAFRMLGKLAGDWLATASSFRRQLDDIMTHGVRGEPDIDAAATRDDGGISILVWHYHDDDEAGPGANVGISVDGWGDRPATLRHFRMDADHSNAFDVWKGMGRPENPSAQEYARLEAAGQLAEIEEGRSVAVTDGKMALQISLPRQGVSLLRLEWQ
jgi:xylan 1,4-beta-xylosidase